MERSGGTDSKLLTVIMAIFLLGLGVKLAFYDHPQKARQMAAQVMMWITVEAEGESR